jgi:hypothetical protein
MFKKIMLIAGIFSFIGVNVQAETQTHRVSLLSNDKVNVWQTIVYPNEHQILKLHRHDYPRVLLALTDGILRVKNEKGQTHLLKLKKDKAYYLEKDIPGEMHTDTNISGHPVKVVVVELKS